MSAPLLKICGIQDAGTAAAIAPLAIDYVGLVFAPSKRRISPEQARELMGALRSSGGRQRFVGVFVNPDIEELESILSVAKLDVLQLHGGETPSFFRLCRERFPDLRLWRAARVNPEVSHTESDVTDRMEPYKGLIDALLLDAYDPAVAGGTGRTFLWDDIPNYRAWTEKNGIPLLIAGGLHADNIGSLIADYAISGVDVSSGVETDGQKDIDKIRNMVERVKVQ